MNDDEPFDIETAAKYLKIQKSFLYSITSKKEISFWKPCKRKIYFSKQDLDNWWKRNRVKSDFEIENEAEKILTKE